MKYDFTVIRSKRKSLSLEIKGDGRIVVRAPLRMSERQINKFIESKRDWLEKKINELEKLRSEAECVEPLNAEELKRINENAKEYIPKRVEHYAKILSVRYSKISIKPLRSKWGSCSREGNLSFNSLLMLAPPEVVDAIVVHELCHRFEMNHSKAFYSYVLSVCPDYKKYNKWLKENGRLIIARLPENKK